MERIQNIKILPIIYQNKTKIPGKKQDVPGLIIRNSKLFHLYRRYLGVTFGETV